MSTKDRPVILLDPYPRPVDVIFDPATKARLGALGEVIWHDGPPAPAEHIDLHLPRTTILIGQSALPRERLDRAPHLKAVFNVESNFLPNIDYAECNRRGSRAVHGPRLREARRRDGARTRAFVRAPDPRGRCADSVWQGILYGERDNYDSILLHGRPVALSAAGTSGGRCCRCCGRSGRAPCP